MEVTAVIEIPKGSSKKYEFNSKTEKFVISRKLPKGMRYPMAFGFIPQTLEEDGDPLDVMILTKRRLKQGNKVRVRPIGMLEVIDNKKHDNKILAVSIESRIRDLKDAKSELDRYQYFFKAYKRGIIIKGWLGKSQAYKEIKYCMKRYKNELR